MSLWSSLLCLGPLLTLLQSHSSKMLGPGWSQTRVTNTIEAAQTVFHFHLLANYIWRTLKILLFKKYHSTRGSTQRAARFTTLSNNIQLSQYSVTKPFGRTNASLVSFGGSRLINIGCTCQKLWKSCRVLFVSRSAWEGYLQLLQKHENTLLVTVWFGLPQLPQ